MGVSIKKLNHAFTDDYILKECIILEIKIFNLINNNYLNCALCKLIYAYVLNTNKLQTCHWVDRYIRYTQNFN